MSENLGLTTIFVEDRATKRRLRRSKVFVIDGESKGKQLVIEKERTTFGRSLICDLVLGDKAVSGTHCEIIATERGFLLRDLGSTNGTYVGELRIKEVWIKPGAVFRAGQTSIRFDPEAGEVEIDLSARESFHGIVGRSVRMREIFATLEKIGPTDLTVLVRGETGTGKELCAEAVHKASRRADKPFVVQDCSAIPKDLIESTLFGHEKGAFTGASDRHKGSFEQADGGTIFLDEIGELSIDLQPKLLRVLENRQVKRVGGDRSIPIDVRVVAATNRDLREMVNEGTFREDLYYRLSVVQVELPALRDRPEDIPVLASLFLDRMIERSFAGEDKKLHIGAEAMAKLQGYPWPGNVRELRNTVERGGALADGEELTVQDLLPNSQQTPIVSVPQVSSASNFVDNNVSFKQAKGQILDTFEASYIRALFEKYNNNVTRSAQAAGLTRYHLRELAKRYGIRKGKDAK